MKAIALFLLFTLAGAASANAECYDVFGCTNHMRFRMADLMSGPNCEFLYTMRNQIYAEHGYCFKTPRAIAAFGNNGCVSSNVNALGLNSIELYNASLILQAERAKRCPE